MAACNKCNICSHQLTKPQTVAGSNRNPSTINRDLERCEKCDFRAAEKQAIDAECLPINHTCTVKEIENHISNARRLILQGIEVEKLEMAIPTMLAELERVKKDRDDAVVQAWLGFVAIWGEDSVFLRYASSVKSLDRQ